MNSKREKMYLKHAKEMGIWLTAYSSILNGTELAADKFRDNLHLCFGFEPVGLQETCDGCGAHFSVEHRLSCKKGGLVLVQHDDIADEWGYLCGLALKPSALHHNQKSIVVVNSLARQTEQQQQQQQQLQQIQQQ